MFEKSISWIIGKIFAILALIATVALGYFLVKLQFLPGKYLVVAFAALAVMLGLTTFLTWDMGRSIPGKIKFCAGIFIAVLLIGVDVVGCVYLKSTISTIQAMTNVKTESSSVSLYVDQDKVDGFEANKGGYTYGILADMDREATDEAIKKLEEKFGFKLNVKEYSNLSDLMNAKDIDGFILNDAYLDIMEEMEGFENIRDEKKPVYTEVVEKEVEDTTTNEKPTTTDKADNNKKDDTATTEKPGEITGDTSISDTAFVVYISGIDTRVIDGTTGRSDANILAAVNTETRQVVLVSTPRDAYVPIAELGGAKDKLTNAGVVGVGCSMNTLSSLYNISIDYYFRVNFGGFVGVIDALGGVDVHSDYAFNSQNMPGYSFKAGVNRMNGTQALAFSRERYAFGTGDRQRGKNQMAVIQGVINKMLSPDMLVNYTSVLDATKGKFGSSVSYSLISEIARNQLANGGDWKITTYVVNGTTTTQVCAMSGAESAVLILNEGTVQTARGMINSVLNGQKIN